MSNNNRSSGTSGLGLSSVLTIIFVVLKLVGVINWSWIWVLAPIWIEAIFVLLIIIGMIIYDKHTERKIKRMNDKWRF